MWENPVRTDYMTRNLTSLLLNWHFSFLRVTPAFLMFFKVVCRHSLYSSWVWPWMMTSSNKHNTLACPSRMSLIHFWKCSGELVILKEGILLKQKWLYGVMSVVRGCDSSSRRILPKSDVGVQFAENTDTYWQLFEFIGNNWQGEPLWGCYIKGTEILADVEISVWFGLCYHARVWAWWLKLVEWRMSSALYLLL